MCLADAVPSGELHMLRRAMARERDPVRADARIRESLGSLPTALRATWEEIRGAGPIDLAGTRVTEAILLRMAAHHRAQDEVKEFLAKRYKGASADFFVEAVLFWLRAVLCTHGSSLAAESERAVVARRGAMRPDISVWDGDKCVAFVECKTQLGWNRHSWEADFATRQLKIQEDHLGAHGFLVVMTAANWGGFGETDKLGSQYFVLSSSWPSGLTEDTVKDAIETPIESLFRQVVAAGSGD